MAGALAALGAGVAPAHAQVGDSVTCVFTGAVELIGPDYELDADATCAGTLNGVPIAPTADPQNVFIVSDGELDGDLCLEGWLTDADGDSTSIAAESGLGTGEWIMGIGYEMHVAGGSGTIKIGGDSLNPNNASGTLGGPYTGTGSVNVEPAPPAVCTAPGDEFLVSGAFTMADA